MPLHLGWHRPATGGTSDSGLSRSTIGARLHRCVNTMAGTPPWRATANGACAEAPPITGLGATSCRAPN